MKILITILTCTFFFSLQSFSQKTEESKKESVYQLGTDVGPLIKLLTNKSDFNNSFSTGVLNFKKVTGLKAFRGNLRFGFQNENIEDNDDSDASVLFVSAGIGFEKHTFVNQKWQYYVGWQVEFGYNQSKTPFSSDKWSSQSFEIGPLIGVQYRLSKKLMLQTEASLDIKRVWVDNNFFSIDPTPFPIQQTRDSKFFQIDIVLPRVLNLVVEF